CWTISAMNTAPIAGRPNASFRISTRASHAGPRNKTIAREAPCRRPDAVFEKHSEDHRSAPHESQRRHAGKAGAKPSPVVDRHFPERLCASFAGDARAATRLCEAALAASL